MEKEIVLKTYIHRYEADIAKGLLDKKDRQYDFR